MDQTVESQDTKIKCWLLQQVCKFQSQSTAVCILPIRERQYPTGYLWFQFFPQSPDLIYHHVWLAFQFLHMTCCLLAFSSLAIGGEPSVNQEEWSILIFEDRGTRDELR